MRGTLRWKRRNVSHALLLLWSLARVQVLDLLADVRSIIPAPIDYEGTRALIQDNPSPLNVVLLQEIQRYNSLLQTIM